MRRRTLKPYGFLAQFDLNASPTPEADIAYATMRCPPPRTGSSNALTRGLFEASASPTPEADERTLRASVALAFFIGRCQAFSLEDL